MTYKKFNKQVLSKDNLSKPDDLLRVVNTLQNNIESSFAPIVSNIQNDSTIISNINLIAGKVNIINHTLNRNLMGYNIILKSAKSDICDNQSENTSQNLTLWLYCENNCTESIEVF